MEAAVKFANIHKDISRAIMGANYFEEPWPHIVMDQVFPEHVYERLLEERINRPKRDMNGRLSRYVEKNDPFRNALQSYSVRRALELRLKFQGVASPRIVCDVDGYESKIHEDAPKKAGTIQFYITEETVIGNGTKIWSRDGKKLIKEVGYEPNTGYAFKRQDYSFHSLGPIKGDRWSLLTPYMK